MSKYTKGIVKINDNIFCHGGISYFISKKYNISEINNVLELITDQETKDITSRDIVIELANLIFQS